LQLFVYPFLVVITNLGTNSGDAERQKQNRSEKIRRMQTIGTTEQKRVLIKKLYVETRTRTGMKKKTLLYGEALDHTRDRRMTKEEEIGKKRGRRVSERKVEEQINGEIQLRIDHRGRGNNN
jgi:hypothetical protein